jgi:hypothetical protein
MITAPVSRSKVPSLFCGAPTAIVVAVGAEVAGGERVAEVPRRPRRKLDAEDLR